jgi:DNA invertase Pin-like site-specific DNA recombinase
MFAQSITKTLQTMETTSKYVAYYRVSTQKQGRSGLGLDAQRNAVRTFTQCTNCIVAEFTEVESGKQNERPALAEAIAKAKAEGATLIVAKLDRLSRNAGFIFALRDSGVKFNCADMPDANTFTVGIMAVMAQQEREMIAKRTREALAAAKRKGTQLGTPGNLTDGARAKGLAVRQANAQARTAQAQELVGLYREKGLTLTAIAEKLNAQGYATSRGKKFSATQVARLLK